MIRTIVGRAPQIALARRTLGNRNQSPLSIWAMTLFTALMLMVLPANADSNTPPASKLFPETTLAYFRIDNAKELRNDFANSSVGKMFDDPSMRPFISDTTRTLSDLFEELAGFLGISLGDLMTIPQGQVSVAVVEGAPPEEDEKAMKKADGEEETDDEIRRRLQRKRRQQNSFGFVVIVDAGDPNQQPARNMSDLVERLNDLATKNQFIRQTESIGKTTLITLQQPRGREPLIEWFQRDGTYVFGVGRRTASDVLQRWNRLDDSEQRRGPQTDQDAPLDLGTSLAGNLNFAAVMNRSMGDEASRPQITFFVDPYNIARRLIARGNSAFFIMPVVEDLGLQKLRGIGGSLFRGGEVIENISHVHVVVDPPRNGFLGVLRPDEVDPLPPDWVPSDVASYLTIQWDIETAFNNLEKIVNRFGGEGTFDRFVENQISKRLDISVREDFIANLTGRYVNLRRYETPASLNSLARVDALQVRDAEKAKAMLDKIKAKLPAQEMRIESISGKQVFVLRDRNRGDNDNPAFERPRNRLGLRPVTRSLTVVGDYLMFSDSRKLMEDVLRTSASANLPRLADDSDFAFIASEIGAKLEGEKPFWLSFNRDAESFRMLYDLIGSEGASRFVDSRVERTPALQRVSDLLKRKQLPDFDTLTKYFSFSGSFGYDEPGGLHFGFMNLRPE